MMQNWMVLYHPIPNTPVSQHKFEICSYIYQGYEYFSSKFYRNTGFFSVRDRLVALVYLPIVFYSYM